MESFSPSEIAGLVTLVSLEGEFDVCDRRRLTDAFAVAAASSSVIVDFDRATYIDSSALHCILILRQKMQESQSDLVLVGLHDSVRRVFEVCHLEALFDIRPSLESMNGELDSSRLQRVKLLSTSIGGDSVST